MATAMSGRPTTKVVPRAEWVAARKELLSKEKEFTRLRDELSRRFEASEGKQTLADLFDGRSQLIVYHFMFGPGWKEGCPSCSLLGDSLDGAVVHLAQRDATLVVVSRATLPEIEAFKKRMGWRFKWVSSFATDFNVDYQVSLSQEERANKKVYYNYQLTEFPSEERPGASVFYQNQSGEVFHTYSTYARGLDMLITAYNYLDLTPKGRDEEGLSHPMAWVRHHDRYSDSRPLKAVPKGARDSCCSEEGTAPKAKEAKK